MGNEDRECKEAPQSLSEHSGRSERAAELPEIKLHPKGVFRFRTFEKFNEWKKQFTDKKTPHDPHK